MSITSCIYIFPLWWEHKSTLINIQLHNMVLPTIIIMLYIWSSNIIHLIAESVYPFISFSCSLYPQHLANTILSFLWHFFPQNSHRSNIYHTIFVVICLTYFTWHNIIMLLSTCCYQHVVHVVLNGRVSFYFKTE